VVVTTPPWKMEYLDSYSTAIRHVARKVATMEDNASLISR